MGPWWLHLLVFIFGYTTCRTFYFLRSARLSLSLIKYSQIIYLSCMHKAIEHLSGILPMVEDANNIAPDDLRQKIDEQISILKNNSINYLINMHPKFYRENLIFDDWESSSNFLEENKEEAFNFWKHNRD